MRLEEITSLIVDAEHKTAPRTESGFPSIRTPNIGRGRLLLEGVYRVSQDTFEKWTRRAVPKEGDLILAREAPVGNVAIVPSNLSLCLGQRTVLIRPDSELVSNKYLCYFLLSEEMQAAMTSKSGGAVVPHLNMKDIRNLELGDLPPLPTQQKIANILSAYDDLIENNLQRIKLLEEAAQHIYKEWFVDFRFPGYEKVKVDKDSGLPVGWEMKKLKEICHIRRDSIKKEEFQSSMIYVGLEHIPRRSTTLKKWGKPSDISSSKLEFKKYDILFGKIRPYFHKVCIAPTEGICSSDTIIIYPKNTDYFGLLTQIISSVEFVDYSHKTCKEGAKMPRANWDVMKLYEVVIPDNLINGKFNSKITSFINQTILLNKQNLKLKEARDILLPRLMNQTIKV